MLEIIFGSKTKVKILETLANHTDGLTRNKIAKNIDLYPRTIYDQIDDLEFLNILSKEGKNYLLNKNHLLYDTLKSFLLIFQEYSINFSLNLLSFIHEKLNNNYYISGYTAACKIITPIDYNESVIHIGVLEDHFEEYFNKLSILSNTDQISINKMEPGSITIIPFSIANIPINVKMENILSHDVYITSITQGVIDCFNYQGLSDYGKCLILLQNEEENLLDYNELKNKIKLKEIPISLQLAIKKANELKIGQFHQLRPFLKLTKKESDEAKYIENSIFTAIKEALHTIQGVQSK